MANYPFDYRINGVQQVIIGNQYLNDLLHMSLARAYKSVRDYEEEIYDLHLYIQEVEARLARRWRMRRRRRQRLEQILADSRALKLRKMEELRTRRRRLRAFRHARDRLNNLGFL
jgi:hypothetical protein